MRTSLLAVVLVVVNNAAQPKTSPPPSQPPSAQHQATNGQEHGKQKERQNANHSNGVAGKNQQQKSAHGATGTQVATRQQSHPNSAPAPIHALRAFWAWFVTTLAGVTLTHWIAIFTAVVALASVYVTTLYFLATVGILLAMATSNNLAKAAQKEGKDAADADRELMRQQLAAMESSSAATNALAVAAKDTAKATADLVEVTQRPWIAVETKLDDGWMGGVAFYGNNDLRVSIQCAIKNIGHSVANNIELRSKLVFLKPEGSADNRDVVSQAQSKLADDPPNGQFGITLFPEEPGILSNWMFAGKADFEDALHDPDDGSTTPRIVPVVVGCVVYEYPNSPIHHATRFAYRIYHKTRSIPPPPPYQPGIDVGVSLRDPNDIGFYKYSGGGGAD